MRQFSRTQRLIGEQAQQALTGKKIAIFGLGGVGSYAAEALFRAGIGHFLLVDGDEYEPSNLNRQLYATGDTLGRAKAVVARERGLSINPSADIQAMHVFVGPDTIDRFDFSGLDYVLDAIDSVTGKLLLIERARDAGVPIISAMGAGNKLDPGAFEVADIYDTSVCPLARVMRRELKSWGIPGLKVVYSREPARKALDGQRAPGSISFVPAAAGIRMAGAVVRDLISL